MSYEIINIPKEYKYVNQVPEFQQDLPDNVYIDKTSTGCGATHAVLTNDVNYVVAVPFIALGENKVDQSEQYPHKLFMFSGKASNEDLYRHIRESGDVKKILVTYDSVPRLLNLINPKDYKLFIDEAHKLIEYAGNFKPKVVYNLLDSLHLFKSYVLCTATPTKEKYLPEKVKGMRKIKLNWEVSKKVNINHMRLNQNQLRASVISLCLQYLRGELEGNIYLFYNSVVSIAKICKDLVNSFGYSHEDINVICADTEKNRKTLKSINKEFYPRRPIEKVDGEAKPNAKKINFVTSTVFEGQDFWDKMGKTYIISDGKLDHTKIDIATQMSQIIGRLRDSDYKNDINMLWTTSPILDYRTLEEYSVYVDKRKEDSDLVLLDFNRMQSNTSKSYIIKGIESDPFLLDNTEGGVLDVITNPDVKNHLLNVYENTEQQYYVNAKDSGIAKPVNEHVDYTLKNIYLGDVTSNLEIKALSNADKLKLSYKGSYTEVAYRYLYILRELQKGEFLPPEFRKAFQEEKTDIELNPNFGVVVEYVRLFGIDEYLLEGSTKKLSEYYLRKKIDAYKGRQKLRAELPYRFEDGQVITNKNLKQELVSIYELFSLPGKPKLTDINLAFETQPTSVLVDGKKENAFKLMRKL